MTPMLKEDHSPCRQRLLNKLILYDSERLNKGGNVRSTDVTVVMKANGKILSFAVGWTQNMEDNSWMSFLLMCKGESSTTPEQMIEQQPTIYV